MTATVDKEFESLIHLLKVERPLFEADYVASGGEIKYLKWNECHDGTGEYGVDWEAVEEAELNSEKQDMLQEDAHYVTCCLSTWVRCTKAKAPPEGYYLMPLQPDEAMLAEAKKEFKDDNIDDLEDKIVFAHQSMIQVQCRAAK